MTELKNLKEIFDFYLGDLKVDEKFLNQIKRWKSHFIGKNAEHVAFFTGAYFGLHIPKWTVYDDNYWLVDVMEIDEDEVSEQVIRLPTINKDWSVSSNVLSIGILYLIHRAQINPKLNPKDRDDLKVTLMEILNYKYISSLMSHYFNKGKTTEDIAKETFNRLSRRFDLKSQGSWLKFIRYRSEGLVLGDYGASKVTRFNKQDIFDTFDDELVVRKLNDTKSRMSSVVKEINAVFRQVLDDQLKIEKHASLKNGSEGLYVANLIRQQSEFLRYQDKIIADKAGFIRVDLIEVIESSMPTISSKIFRGVLDWILEHTRDKKYAKDIDEMRHGIITYGMTILTEENIKTTNLLQIAYRIRQNFMSGKAKDPTLVKCRQITDDLIHAYRPKSKGKLVTNERVGVLMYIFLRTIAMHYYK